MLVKIMAMFDRKDFTFAKKSSVVPLKVLIISEKRRKLQFVEVLLQALNQYYLCFSLIVIDYIESVKINRPVN